MKILVFGTYDLRSHPRTGVIVDGLREHGDEVVEVNVPLGLNTADRVAMLRQPWRLPLLAVRLLRCWSALAFRGPRAQHRLRSDAVLVGYLGHFDVRLARLLFRHTTIVLDHLIFAADTARDRGLRRSWKMRLLQWLDRAALRAADVVLLDTSAHAALMPADLADRALVVPVGAQRAWFAAAGRRDADGPLRVVFYGLFTPLQGAPVIGSALAELADDDIEVTMIGHGQDLARSRQLAAANTRVTWRDWVPAEELPAVVAGHDVCLGIFDTGPKAQRVVPNKVYQGAAAGCAILTSDTAPQRQALAGAAAFVPPGDPGALAATLRRLAADRTELARLRQAASERAAAAFTAAAVVLPLRARLLGATPATRTGARTPYAAGEQRHRDAPGA